METHHPATAQRGLIGQIQASGKKRVPVISTTPTMTQHYQELSKQQNIIIFMHLWFEDKKVTLTLAYECLLWRNVTQDLPWHHKCLQNIFDSSVLQVMSCALSVVRIKSSLFKASKPCMVSLSLYSAASSNHIPLTSTL